MVNPKDLHAALSADINSQLAALEPKIDDYLRTHFRGYDERIIFPPPPGTRPEALSAIAEKYRRCGWIVRIVAPHRDDGDELEFIAHQRNNG